MLGSRMVLVSITLCLICGSLAAEPFARPPEDTWPEMGGVTPEWVIPYPYHRNVMLRFATDPSSWAADADNPLAWELNPATNYDMYGSYDMTLYNADWLRLEVLSGVGPSWYGSDPYGSSRTGLFGVYQVSAPTQWRLTLHMNTPPDSQPLLRTWQEFNILSGGVSYQNLTLPAAFTGYTQYHALQPGSDWKVWNLWHEMERAQGPIEFQHTVNVIQGGSFLIDDYHVATECTPEPVSAVLLLLGAPVALALRRRRDANE